MLAELRQIEKVVNLVVGKPLAWVVYGCWLVIVYLAVFTVWLRVAPEHPSGARGLTVSQVP